MGSTSFSKNAATAIGARVKLCRIQNLEALFGVVLIGVVAWFVFDFPILRLWLALGFTFYAACLWRWPRIWLFAVPALLPAFDLAPWSGRFFFNEFDAFVLLTAG